MIFLFPRWDMLIPWRLAAFCLVGMFWFLIVRLLTFSEPIFFQKSRQDAQREPGNSISFYTFVPRFDSKIEGAYVI